VIYDYDEGGNGVSELIGHYLPHIIYDALSLMRMRHIRTHNMGYRFFGEPGDIILGRWPTCPYGNVGLSRWLLLLFFELLIGLPLSRISSDQIEEYIPEVI